VWATRMSVVTTALRQITGYVRDDQWPSGLKPATEVATVTGLALSRVLELADAHVIPHWRIDGGEPLFRIAEVKDWLARTHLLTRYEGKPIPMSFIVATEVPAVASDVPLALRPMAKDLQFLPIAGQRAGIYFLCVGDGVVYVGQSVCPVARVAQHLTSGKVFDRAFVYPCLPEHLNLLEGALIRALVPELNGNGGPVTDDALLQELYPSVRACSTVPASCRKAEGSTL
jgi:excisionase family DNA binding protein